MKTIVIPTDFSPAADNAMHYGAQLAQTLQANILLMHVYAIPVTSTDKPVILISADELRKGADDGLARCKDELATAYPDMEVKTDSRLGDIIDELRDLCTEIKPYAVVMATHSTSGMDQLLFGSNTAAAIRKLHYPIIAVPIVYRFTPVKKIVLASDLDNVERTPVDQITAIVKNLNAQLHIVHVENKKEKENKEEASNKLLSRFQEVQPGYHTLQDDDIVHALQIFTSEINADLLIVLPHEHSWLESFFFKLHARQIINRVQVPVLCIPE